MDQQYTETSINNSETLGQTLSGIAQSAELIARLADEKSSIQAAASVIINSVEKVRASITPLPSDKI